MSTGTLERRTEAKVWRLDEGGYAVRAADTATAKAALSAWLMDEPDLRLDEIGVWSGEDDVTIAREVAEYVDSLPYREGWYRWTPCNPKMCYEGTQHRPGHLSYERGPARGVWRGVLVDHPVTADPTAAGLAPAGRCDGTAGDAETLSGPPEDIGVDDETASWALRAIAEAQTERDQARRIAVTLECEVAALTDALRAVTHEFLGVDHLPCLALIRIGPVVSSGCGQFKWDRIHRTPARVRAELEGP